MASGLTFGDYRPAVRPHKTASSAGRDNLRLASQMVRPVWRREGLTAVEAVLQLLARAVLQFHTYPPKSPLCVDAIAACHAAIASLDARERLDFRVTPRELLVGDLAMGAGTIIEQELARRLYRAHVAALTIDRGASPRDLSRFCADLIRCRPGRGDQPTLAELLVEHGVDKIVPTMAPRPEVFDIGAPSGLQCDLVEGERTRRERLSATDGPVSYLYPPDKGWVRLDPAASFRTISLVDLALLVDDPGEVAGMLLRLTDGPSDADARDAALEMKFSDVARLCGAMDPRLARLMFAKLARAVLDLDTSRRNVLLQQTILPGLLEARVDGAILQDFPDLDLAEALCLLLDLETAGPEVLAAALRRLELPAERQQAVVPLLEARLQTRATAESSADDRRPQTGIDRYADKLIRIEPVAGKRFAEFAAFDLSIDAETTATIGQVRDAIDATDPFGAQLECLRRLVRLEPNPSRAETLLQAASAVLAELERGGRWQELAAWVTQFRHLGDGLHASRPDVADAVSCSLSAFWTRDRALHLLELHQSGGADQAVAGTLVEAFGVTMAPVFVALLEDSDASSHERPLVRLMCEHAKVLAPALVPSVDHCTVGAARALVRVLGFAGSGYEKAIAAQLGQPDAQMVREGLRALARIGTGQAAALIAVQIRQGSGSSAEAAAEEALWHFPPDQIRVQLRELLRRHDFVRQKPRVAARLLDRAAHAGADGLEQTLVDLARLRFRFWNPGLVRVAFKARRLLAS